MSNHPKVCGQGCPNHCPKSEKSCRRIPSRIPSLLLIFYSLLKMPMVRLFWIQTQNSTLRISTLPNQNYSLKIPAFMQPHLPTSTYKYHSISWLFSTPRIGSPKFMTSCLINTKNLSSPSQDQSPMSAWQPSKVHMKISETLSRCFHENLKSHHLADQNALSPTTFQSWKMAMSTFNLRESHNRMPKFTHSKRKLTWCWT